jgi:hypothetical protein
MAETVRRVRPTPTDAYLANPHKGCCTFQRFHGDELYPGTGWLEEGPHEFPPPDSRNDLMPGEQRIAADGYPPSTVAYCRWFWTNFEPEEGRYDFSLIDRAIETAKSRGQTLAMRIMAYGNERRGHKLLPAWYKAKYPVRSYEVVGEKGFEPIPDSPEFLEKYGNIIRECGRRYDGHLQIETMDVGYLGPLGEFGEMSNEQMHRFNQVHAKAFSRTFRLVEICGEQGKIGLQYRSGWRWNCYGDLSDRGSSHVVKSCSWNHTYDLYPEILATYARDNWKHHPVHCEIGPALSVWRALDWDLDFILQQGLKYHMTYFMAKSCRIPAEWMDKINAFCRKLGYRFVYRQALYDTPVKAGSAFKFRSWIENTGVAPLYRKYDFALRLRQSDHEEIITLKDVDSRTWLPGDAIIDASVQLPVSIKPGYVHLAAGLIDPTTREARVRFAAKENFSDRWLSLGGIEVV